MTGQDPRLLDGRYEVGELVGRGGMAEVHKGYDIRLGREVAIKLLRSDLARDASFLIRFNREAKSSAGLNHASIVAVYDSGKDSSIGRDGQPVEIPYIVMEFVDGRTLREILTERGTLPPKEAARLTEGVLDALAYSHRQGIVHRDIKPANVMIGHDGSIKVMDFGIARAMADTAATMTQTHAVIGTAQYLSPEQAQGLAVDARSDLYSTGCMLYELLTGRPPFVGDSPVAIAYQHVGEAPLRPSAYAFDVPPDLDAVVMHALAKSRDARYHSAADFRSDLQATRLGRPISAEAAGTKAATDPTGAPLGGTGAGAPGVAGGAVAAGAVAGGAASAAASELATQRLSPVDPNATQVYGDPSRQTAQTTAVPAASGPAYRSDLRDPSTGSFPPVGSEERQRSRRSLGWIALIVASLVALGLIGWGINNYLQAQANNATVAVPDVTGKPVETATAELIRDGFIPQVERQKSDTVQEGIVIDQNPKGGLKVDKGSDVTIYVSSGADAVTIPDLAGRTEAQARADLERLKLTVGDVTEVDDSNQDKGKVVESTPAAGEQVASGSSVTLKISSGKVTVPDLKDKTRAAALQELTALGLVPDPQPQQSSSVPADQVISQSTAAGEKVDRGSTVTFTYATAAPSPTATTPSPSSTPTPSAGGSSPSTSP